MAEQVMAAASLVTDASAVAGAAPAGGTPSLSPSLSPTAPSPLPVFFLWNPPMHVRPDRPPPVVPVYAGMVRRVVAPDLLEVDIDLAALGLTIQRVVRLAGCYTATRDTPSGGRVMAWIRDWIRSQSSDGPAISVSSSSLSFPVVIGVSAVADTGQLLCWIWARHSGRCLNIDMVDAGVAVGWRFGRQTEATEAPAWGAVPRG